MLFQGSSSKFQEALALSEQLEDAVAGIGVQIGQASDLMSSAAVYHCASEVLPQVEADERHLQRLCLAQQLESILTGISLKIQGATDLLPVGQADVDSLEALVINLERALGNVHMK